MTVADVKDAEAAQAVQIRAPEYVAVGVRPGIRPFNNGAGLARIGRFPVFEKSGINVVAERVDRFASDPRRFVGRDLGFLDERQNALRVFVDGSFSLCGCDRHAANTCAVADPNIAKPSSSCSSLTTRGTSIRMTSRFPAKRSRSPRRRASCTIASAPRES